MVRILDKVYGKRTFLVCSGDIEESSNAPIKIHLENDEIFSRAAIQKSRNCFSESDLVFIMLEKSITKEIAERITEIEILKAS